MLRALAILFAILLAGSEAMRWGGSARLVPMAFDEWLVAAALAAAALAPRRLGPAPMAAAWGLFNGLVLGLLVPTLDHLLNGPDKESALFYAAALGAVQIVGLAALAASLGLIRGRRRRR